MAQPTLHVACLCAAWCRLCDDYAAVIAEVAADFRTPGSTLRWHWIDIEDEADLVGDLDVPTFPTLVVLDETSVRFAGPLAPHADTLRRVLRASLAADAPAGAVDQAVQAFAQRLRLRAAG